MKDDRTHFATIYPGVDDEWQSPSGTERSTLIQFPDKPNPCIECGRPTKFMDLCSEQWVCCRRCQDVFWDVFEAVASGAASIIHRRPEPNQPIDW